MQVAARGACGLMLEVLGASIWEANPWGLFGGTGKAQGNSANSRRIVFCACSRERSAMAKENSNSNNLTEGVGTSYSDSWGKPRTSQKQTKGYTLRFYNPNTYPTLQGHPNHKPNGSKHFPRILGGSIWHCPYMGYTSSSELGILVPKLGTFTPPRMTCESTEAKAMVIVKLKFGQVFFFFLIPLGL